MHPKKKSLSLARETLRQLNPPALATVHGGMINVPKPVPRPTERHSCFDSCYNTDCCLIEP